MRLLRRSVVGIPALALGLTLLSQVAAFAQTRTGEDVQRLEAITVTGSRIKKAEAEGQTPVITISAKISPARASVGDIIQQLSVSGSALNTKFNSAGNFGFAPDGSGVGSASTRSRCAT